MVVAEEFNNYFASVGSDSAKLAEEIAQKFDLPCPTIPLAPGVDIEGDNMFQLSPVTSDDVSDIIMTMHSNISPGNDTIHINVLKDCLSSIVYPITSLVVTTIQILPLDHSLFNGNNVRFFLYLMNDDFAAGCI